MGKLKFLAVAAVLVGVVYFALRPQLKYAKIVMGISEMYDLVVPIEAALLESIQKLAESGPDARVHGLKPSFVYQKAITPDGRTLTVRAAYSEKLAPQGALMTMDFMAFLRSAADDPKAEGVSFNPGAPPPAFSATIDKATVLRAIESLKQRGYKDPAGP